MVTTFKSQFGEDIYILNNYINNYREDGVFVELGAMNGDIYSNSFFFEDTLGFNGVLIEPTDQYEQLIKNRPKCKNVNLAVNYNNNYGLFTGNGACGGLSSTMSNKFKEDNHKDSESYFVNCAPFSKILHNNNITYIDLLSIDVEGGELVVLETMDFSIPVFVIVIELDGYNKEKDEKCRNILRNNGFTFDIRVNINEFWINKNYQRKELLFNKNTLKLNFSNMYNYDYIPSIDMNHPYIHELKDSLLLDNSIVK